jgi:heme exporter protein B
MRPLITLLGRELALGWGRGGGPLPALAFYAAITVLLPLAAGPDTSRLAPVATGVAWMALALASLLSLERLFERDFEDGGLDLLMTGPLPLELVCAVKCLSQWMTTAAPLALAAPVAAVMLGALALGARRGGLLVAAIVLPLFSPPVIFGGAALYADQLGSGAGGGLLLLLGWTAAAVALSPLAMAAACRNAVQ